MRYSILFLSLALTSTAAAQAPQAAPAAEPPVGIRDIRPTKLQLGDKLFVEGTGPVFTVGAPTKIILDDLVFDDGKPAVLEGRAVARDRILADIDEAFANGFHHRHVVLWAPAVIVEQTIDGKPVRFMSHPAEHYAFDFFPPSAQKLANKLAAGVAADIPGWLGITLDDHDGVVQVVDVVRHVDHEALLSKYERAPFDGKLTKEEARVGQPGGLPEPEFKRYDENGDGTVELHELEEQPSEDGLGAKAGLAAGDVITHAAGRPITSVAQFSAAWQTDAEKVPVTVKRGGGTSSIDLPRAGSPMAIPPWLLWALVLALIPGIIALPIPVIAGLVVVWERKISAYMQSRLGPNRVGPAGWLQWLADGLKLIMKEDIVPKEADPILFRMSPYLAFIGLFLTFTVLPFSHVLIASDLNIGLLFLLSVTSLVVVSIIMGGWSSNSKWALLGGMRSAAQIISYELPASVALLTIATLTGSLSTQDIVESQGGNPWNWYVFHSPFTMAAFVIFFVSALAEGNRTPFDLPEAESELVSGFNTEYSGFRFSLFPMVEWVNLFVIGAVATMLFLGGWRIPFVSPLRMESSWLWELLGFAIFLAKDIAIIFVIIWIRWTLPRFRVDQMMNLCWKYFIPASFVCFMGTVFLTWVMPPLAVRAMNVAMFAIGALAFGWFLTRVRYNSVRYKDLVLNDRLGRVNA